MNAPLDLLALRIDAALAALRAGRPVIVSDDADREDEADLILAADTLSVTEMARMIRDGSGIVCLCLTAEHAARLELPLMVAENRSRHGTAFTVSIEAAEGVSTGVSARDRVTTIRAATVPGARAEHLARPGHVYPLIARPGGLAERRGHTEAAAALPRPWRRRRARLCAGASRRSLHGRAEQLFDGLIDSVLQAGEVIEIDVGRLNAGMTKKALDCV